MTNTDWPRKRIAVNGIELNVVDVGEGEPVLLIHGFPDTHTVWRKQIPVLIEAGYRVIAPDTRGCGESDIPPREADYKLQVLTRDLVALLDALQVDKARVIGHDWGAVQAWQLALHHPERVSQLVALSVGHPTAYARDGLMQKVKGWYVLFFQLRVLAEVLLKASEWWLFRAIINYAPEWPHLKPVLARPGRLTAGIRYYRANWIRLLNPVRFPSAQIPVVGLYSSGDRYLTRQQMVNSQKYCAAGFRYCELDGVNHWLQLDAPEATNRLLLNALQQGQNT